MGDSTSEPLATGARNHPFFSVFGENLLRCGFAPDDHFLIAFSGGLDSAAMLCLMRDFCANPGQCLRVAHVHHGLSPNADEWSTFCRQVCEDYMLPYQQISLELGNTANLEATARHARYAALLDLMRPEETLLVAHHRDDNVETLLLNLLRGTGTRGLAGIPNRSRERRVFRPMLPFSRRKIHEYALYRKLRWMEDESNLDLRFERNYLRLEIIPRLRERWPGFDRTLTRAMQNMHDTSCLLDQLAEEDFAAIRMDFRRPWSFHRLAFDLPGFRKLSRERRNNLLQFLWRELSVYAPPRDGLLRLSAWLGDAESGMMELRDIGVRICQGRAYLFDDSVPAIAPDAETPWRLEAGASMSWGGYQLSASLEKGRGARFSEVDLENLSIGARRQGETIRLPGRAHRSSLKKILQEQKIPAWERHAMPVIRVRGEAAAIPGMTVLEPYSAGPDETGFVFRMEQKNAP